MGAVGYTGGDPNKVDVVGDTMTGPLVLPGDPASGLQAATKDYVDTHSGGGGGSGTPSGTVVSETTYGQSPAAGATTTYSRGDHTHGTPAAVGFGNVVTETSFGQASNNGVASTVARSDHTHGTPTAPTVPSASSSVAAETSFGIASAAGAAATFSRGDHTHGSPTAPTAASVGAAATVHTHVESDVTSLVADLAGKQPLDADLTTIAGLTATTGNVIQSVASAWASQTPAQLKTSMSLVKGDVGLGNVDNTSDVNKPVSTAQQTALNLKADLASPTFTGTPTLPTGSVGVTQTAGNNTTALATTAFVTTADNLKANLASPTFTGTPAAPTAAPGTNTTQLATTAFATTADALKANIASPTFTGTVTTPRLILPPVGLTDAATIATDASLGNHFRVTLGGNRTLGNPTNPTDGQRVIWELIQDGTGTRTITLDTKFALGTDITAVTLTTTLNKRDFLGAVYNSTADKWFVIAFMRGY